MHTKRVQSSCDGRQRRAWIVLGTALLMSLGTMACNGTVENGNNGNGGTKTDGIIQLETGTIGAFSHDVHLEGAGLKCESCHSTDDNDEVSRPGLNAHSPCDTCHEDMYYKDSGRTKAEGGSKEFCATCHTEINPLVEGATQVAPYPRPGRISAAQLIMAFNHKKHLARGRDCGSCHTVKRDKDAPFATLPRHANCVKCHGSGAVKPTMKECRKCHNTKALPQPKRFLTNDIRFTHGKHFVDNKKGEISCETCHAKIFNSTDASDRGLPDMELCAKCHENATKTSAKYRIRNCQVCHISEQTEVPDSHKKYTAGLDLDEDGGLKPVERAGTWEALTEGSVAVVADIRGLIPMERDLTKRSGKRPDNHNALFRTRHGQAASMPDAKCGFCHTSTSGSPKDNCADCHSTWRPRDHNLRWRGVEHGRAAAQDASRCSTCHMTEFCTECHNIPPPNHSPLISFRSRHAVVARKNARACLTCHSFETTCSECHFLDVVPFGLDDGN